MSDFLNPYVEVNLHGTKLPHWQQGEVLQFVTIRLADSLPQSLLLNWKREKADWLKNHPEPFSSSEERVFHHQFSKRIEDWLDQGMGNCLFRKSSNRAILAEILMKDHGKNAEHISWVIMPNHVHLLFKPLIALEKLMKNWKSISARYIDGSSIWQREYHDTMIRNAEHLESVIRYIRRNPENLATDQFMLWESERAKNVI